MTLAIDTNVLFYALDSEDARHLQAIDVLASAVSADVVMPAQVYGELLNAVRRKRPQDLAEATRLVAAWMQIWPTAPTRGPDIRDGADLAVRYRLQFWDGVILSVAARSSATVLLSEDMQDGQVVGGVTLLNPFLPANTDRLSQALAS